MKSLINKLKTNDKIKNKLRALCSESEITTFKNVVLNNLSSEIKNPFELLNITNLTEIQRIIKKCCDDDYFKKYGNLAISASCGSGKTLTGVYLIYRLQCKTLIISTRNAVKDQWKTLLKTLYPNLIIKSKPVLEADIWLLTPQYFNCHENDEIKIKPSLIIYDEIHTMLSECFSEIIKYPFLKCLSNEWTELPFLLSLSATYPKDDKIIKNVFGPIISPKHNKITEIPIKIYDIRNEFTLKQRGKFDEKYYSMNEFETIKHFVEMKDFLNLVNEKIKTKEKGLIMMKTIDASLWCALFIQKLFKVKVLLIRTDGEKNYLIDNNNIKFNETISLTSFKPNDNIKENKNYNNLIKEAKIIVSTISRMKEGFSCDLITWGICVSFPWNPLSRVQISGRYRRQNEKIKHVERFVYVKSSKVPTTLFSFGKRNFSQAKIKYDFDYENELFKKENINFIN